LHKLLLTLRSSSAVVSGGGVGPGVKGDAEGFMMEHEEPGRLGWRG
jgi:hypothetical protein